MQNKILKKKNIFKMSIILKIEKDENNLPFAVIYKEFSPYYYVSRFFKIFSKISNRYISINPNTFNVLYTIDKKRKYEKIYNIVARMFLNKEDDKPYVIFKDGNPNNMKISNLAWSEKKFKKTIEVNNIEEEIFLNDEKIIKEVELRKCNIENYYVSEYSKVYSKRQGKLREIARYKRSNGIEYIKGIDSININILVMRAFYPDQKELKYVLYKDKNKLNTHYTNLMWSDLPELKEDFEKFKILEGFSKYKFSKDGICKSYFQKEPKIMKPYEDDDGYFSFYLKSDKGKGCKLRRSRIIATIFIENPYNLPQVDHINRERSDDRVENLKWVSVSENIKNRGEFKKRNKPILQYDIDGNIIKNFYNFNEVVDYLNENNLKFSKNKLKNHLKEDNINKTPLYGYIWIYLFPKKEKYIFKENEIGVSFKGIFEEYEIDFPKYKITNYGNIINKDGYKISSNIINGYLCSNLSKNGKTVNLKIHKWVALFFVSGRTEEKKWVNHIDENKLNPYYKNLEWVSPKENILHSSYKFMKPVDQFDMKTGEFIQRFVSVKEASKHIGSAADSIGNVCRRNKGSLYGYIWKFSDININSPEAINLDTYSFGNSKTKNKK